MPREINNRGERFLDEGEDFRNYTYAKYGKIILQQPDSVAEEPTTIAAAGSIYERGSGVLDLASSLRSGGEVHASGAIAAHVLDVLIAASEAAESGETVKVSSTVEKPTPLPEAWNPAAATL